MVVVVVGTGPGAGPCGAELDAPFRALLALFRLPADRMLCRSATDGWTELAPVDATEWRGSVSSGLVSVSSLSSVLVPLVVHGCGCCSVAGRIGWLWDLGKATRVRSAMGCGTEMGAPFANGFGFWESASGLGGGGGGGSSGAAGGFGSDAIMDDDGRADEAGGGEADGSIGFDEGGGGGALSGMAGAG